MVPHFQHLPISCRTQAATPNRPAPEPKTGWTGPCAGGLNGGGYRLTGLAFAVTCIDLFLSLPSLYSVPNLVCRMLYFWPGIRRQ